MRSQCLYYNPLAVEPVTMQPSKVAPGLGTASWLSHRDVSKPVLYTLSSTKPSGPNIHLNCDERECVDLHFPGSDT